MIGKQMVWASLAGICAVLAWVSYRLIYARRGGNRVRRLERWAARRRDRARMALVQRLWDAGRIG